MSNRVNLGNIRGQTGLRGERGEPGVKGDDGLTPTINQQNGHWMLGTYDTGVTAKGSQWFTGSVTPTAQGVDGDLYFNTSTNDVYKKENGVWGIVGNIQGEQGIRGEKGETALSVSIGSVTTGEAGTEASVTNSGTDTDLVLDFVIPKGEKGETGEQGQDGRTSVNVGGFIVSTLTFDSDPQGQINEKLDKNLGSQNSGKYLQVGNDGEVRPVGSDAENDVIEGYYYNGAFYEDVSHETLIIGVAGKIYVDLTENLQYRYDGTDYIILSSNGTTKITDTTIQIYNLNAGVYSWEFQGLGTINCGNMSLNALQAGKFILIVNDETGGSVDHAKSFFMQYFQTLITGSCVSSSLGSIKQTNSLRLLESYTNGSAEWDIAPVQNSDKPVTSGGIYSALALKQDTLTIDSSLSTTSTNPVENKAITIAVNEKANKTQAVASISLTMNSSTYVLTLQPKDINGNNIGSAQTVDLPLESVVVNGSYDSATKKVILTLQSGSTIEFSVADLVSGLQTEITSSNKLSADLIDENTNKQFVSQQNKNTWNGKQDAITSSNKLNADLLQDGSTNKTVTATEKSTWNGKQDQLQSGTNIKTINGNSILGSGDLTVGGGQATDVQVDSNSITQGSVANIKTKNGNYNASTNKLATENDLPTIDSALSTTSENAVQNKLVTNELNKKVTSQIIYQGVESSVDYTSTTKILNKNDNTQRFVDMIAQMTYNDSAMASSEYLHELYLGEEGIYFYTKSGTGTAYSGVMIGAISEVGTNYIRSTDGTQICFGKTTGSAQQKTVTFAKAFKSGTTPIVTTGVQNSGDNNTQRTVCVSSTISNTGCKFCFSASTDFQATYIAIGKYK